jgi:FAD synthetase
MTAPTPADSASTVAPPNDPSGRSTSPLDGDTPLSFPQVCSRIDDRITAFLDEKDVSQRVESVQEQTRISLRVIDEALERYRYAAPLSNLHVRGHTTCPINVYLQGTS